MTKIAKTANFKPNIPPQVTSLEASPSERAIIKPLNVLITRPEIKGKQLAFLLGEHKIPNTCQALFDYRPYASGQQISLGIKKADIIIFVSVAAVEFAHASQPLLAQARQLCVAVGNATKQALHAIGITRVISPTAQAEHSEGLLNLMELNQVHGKNVVIIRGNGGREYLADSLIKRGAQVNYIESYQRIWRTLPKNIAKQWQAQQINCIVVTSNDILKALVKNLNNDTGMLDNYWQKKCLWVVVSERIANTARTLGLQWIVNAQSANSQTICSTIQDLSCE
jgi:uroporphyrinogen-III synthase